MKDKKPEKTKKSKKIIPILCVLEIIVIVLVIIGSHIFKRTGGEPAKEEEKTGKKSAAQVNDDGSMEPWELEYVDAHGEHYTALINPELRMHTYDWSKLTRKGEGDISYEGDEWFTVRKGVDVAEYQGDIDWQQVKDAGYEFAIIRIGSRAYGGEGQILEDEAFEKNIQGAQEAGLDVGVYFFSQAVSEEETLEEAAFVLDKLNGYELQLPIVFDPETIRDDEARTDDVSGTQFTDNAIAFCEEVQRNGYIGMIYANMVWEDQIFEMERLQYYMFWYADYEKEPQTPYDFRFWQYTEKGEVPGIDGKVDLDVEFMPVEMLK